LMSAVMMLNHLADTRGDAVCGRCAERIRDAYNAALRDGRKTRDLGGDLGTDAFTDALIERLR
ncbi:MAG: isocitrate/isopropylmalate family dehydrogenase, partial [Pirellulaceae bacterium]|nr:isocitrate/isopropylmalate family dehydrogenase [Pirellulaceae bacterium]